MVLTETLALIVQLTPTAPAYRALQLVNARFRVSAAQQHHVRVRFRTLQLCRKASIMVYKYMLPNGRRDGLRTTMYGGGTCRGCIYYVNDMRHGVYTMWWISGQTKIKSTYRDGMLCGRYLSWHECGQLFTDRYYRNGYLHGECMCWGTAGDMFRHTYHNGKPLGPLSSAIISMVPHKN